MRKFYLKFLLITLSGFSLLSCEEDVPVFNCEQNTVFQFAGSSEKWCGRSELRQYRISDDQENGSIFIRYPAGNVTINFLVSGSLIVGQNMTYGNEFGLAGDVGSVNSASMVITQLDRDQGLISFQFYFDYHAQTNLTHWDVNGTVTDLALEVE